MEVMFICLLFISMLFSILNNPMTLMISIVIQTLIMCMILWLFLSSSWFSYILFLIFIGGLMILFMYISSLTLNNKFNNIKLIYFFMGFYTMMMLSFFLSSNSNLQNFNKLNFESSFLIFKMYSKFMYLPMISTMLFLLITLIVVVEMTYICQAPLRSNKIKF